MFGWLRRLFRRDKAANNAPELSAPKPADIGVVPYGGEASIRTAVVNRRQEQQLQEARALSRQSPELSVSQAHAALNEEHDEGPRAEIIIQPADGMALPVLPADLAPETTAVPSLSEDYEPTRRLPPLSERTDQPSRGPKKRWPA
jgi:hypothetical protein